VSTGSDQSASHARRLRIALVEDHVILREGLRALLEIEPDFEVVADVGNGQIALAMARAVQPDIVITDLALPGRSGIDLIGELRAALPAVRVLVLTVHNTEEYIRASLNAGAHGYVLKDASRADLLQAVRAIAVGQPYLCPPVAAKVVSGYLNGSSKGRSLPADSMVTERERQVLTRIALGQSNKIIARELSVSVKTVEKHRSNLMRKLTLHNTAAITMFAIRHGYVAAEDVPDLLGRTGRRP
jgi:DNA-binding NarL/FixJ family response regulator